MNHVAEDILKHYGVGANDNPPGRGSGRYPLGSGKNPFQHGSDLDFVNRFNELKKDGKTNSEIALELGAVDQWGKPVVTKLLSQYRVANNQVKIDRINKAKELYSKGLGPTAIGNELGESESTIRGWLKKESEPSSVKVLAEYLKKQVDEYGMLDVGAGTEKYLGADGNPISRGMLDAALSYLELEGYEVYTGGIPQVTNKGQQSIQKVIGVPGTEHKDIYDYSKIHSIKEIKTVLDKDGGTWNRFEYPESMDSSRLQVRYGEEGGKDKDGVIEIRRGVEDLSLGNSHYAQVRILVDGSHYLKGMAVYSDDLPPGVDVIFNTNKNPTGNKLDALKKISSDPNNPFGSLIKDPEHGGQSYYIDPNGKFIDPKTGERKSLSLINKRADEGDWDDWTDTLPTQFLAKQTKQLIDRQLYLTKTNKEAELKEILALNNPTIKRKLLYSFAEDCDAQAEHLKAAALPGQRWNVILPLTSIKDTEAFAPNFEDGQQLALVRYPHAGIFEIPIVTVNNKNKEGTKIISKNAKDAIGINSKVAERLSGADFDGDTVMAIPLSNKYKISSRPQLEGLKDENGDPFDPKRAYGYASKKEEKKGKKVITRYYDSNGKEFKAMKNTQTEMGIISNLIADMSIKGASDEELARAVRHSMVVIDAEKHGLDYKKSYKDNKIEELKQLYQAKPDSNSKKPYGGASTLITRAKAEVSVDKRQGQPKINIKGEDWYDSSKPEGSWIYKTTEKLYFEDPKTGKTKKRMQASTQMREHDDAYELISEVESNVEIAYADFANSMKAIANRARKEYVATGKLKQSDSAKKLYSEEVKVLNAKLNLSLTNAPREREAQRRANVIVKKAKENYISEEGVEMPSKEEKKVAQLALEQARLEVNAKRKPINITEKEWEAIQAGAISDSKLSQIINFVKDDELKQLATPKNIPGLSNSEIAKIRSMSARGYTNAEIADAMKISPSTVSKHL